MCEVARERALGLEAELLSVALRPLTGFEKSVDESEASGIENLFCMLAMELPGERGERGERGVRLDADGDEYARCSAPVLAASR